MTKTKGYSNTIETMDKMCYHRVLEFYRYISLFITSLFYLAGKPYYPLMLKLGVVASLLFAALVVSGLYRKYSDAPDTLKAVLFIEILGTAVLLIPTGGMESPFIWYALNPVLVAAGLLPSYLCWAGLLVYLVSATFTSAVLFNEAKTGILPIIIDNAQMFLVFFLITLAVQLLSGLMQQLRSQAMELESRGRELMEVNSRLEQLNERYKDLLEHIMALYHSVEAFTCQDNADKLASTIAEYATKLTGTEVSFFRTTDKVCRAGLFVAGNRKLGDEDIRLIDEISQEVCCSIGPQKVDINGRELLVAPVRTPDKIFGVMGIDIKSCDKNFPTEQYEKQLTFLSDLSAIILERFHLEDVANRLLIVEEQNRIANEIHDGVAQRLFGMVCAIHTLISKKKELTENEITAQLVSIMNAANKATQEIRAAIYQLSPAKSGKRELLSSIKEYVSDLARLNGIVIDFSMNGDERTVDITRKKSLYRIISEAAGNAVRHGKCSKIKIVLEIRTDTIRLCVQDDGKGFDVDKMLNRKERGLGLDNIHSLVKLLNGVIDIKSESGIGTRISVEIPNGKKAV